MFRLLQVMYLSIRLLMAPLTGTVGAGRSPGIISVGSIFYKKDH